MSQKNHTPAAIKLFANILMEYRTYQSYDEWFGFAFVKYFDGENNKEKNTVNRLNKLRAIVVIFSFLVFSSASTFDGNFSVGNFFLFLWFQRGKLSSMCSDPWKTLQRVAVQRKWVIIMVYLLCTYLLIICHVFKNGNYSMVVWVRWVVVFTRDLSIIRYR